MNQPDQIDFFISYNKADIAWAEWIAWELEEARYKVILQAWDFHPGSNFVLEMQRAAELSDHTIAVLSPDYLTALYTQPEWAAAFAQDPTGEKGTLIPVRVKKCELKGLLKPIIYIDLFDQPEENAARITLSTGVKRERRKPSSPPPFPGAIARQISGKPRFPGALPPIWNVLHQRNPNFTGRQQLLDDLHTSLTEGKVAALTALHGLGGVGKTQLALEYAYRFASDYDLVWWVRSEDPATLAGEYAALAGPLNLPEKDAAQQEIIVAAVRQCLGQKKKWLLVFDNAADPKDIKGFLPQGSGGHVLITSRYPAWRGTARPLDVKVWDRPESVAFLLKRTGQQDEAAAAELAQELGDLPLALEQAAAYMDACGESISGYLKLFRQRHQELLNKGQSSQNYPDTVATTWSLSFQKVQEASPVAADLLNLCAFLAPDDIPMELLKMGAEHLPERLVQAINDPLAWNEVRATLRRYSLMDMSDDSMSIHRLVQAVVRDRLDKKRKEKWASAALDLLNGEYSGDFHLQINKWVWWGRLLPHALVAAGHSETFGFALPTAVRLLNQAGFYLKSRAEFNEAQKAYARSLAIRERILKPNDPAIATALNNMAALLCELKHFKKAKEYLERALAIDEAAYDPKHTEVARDVNNLGSVLRGFGDLAGARTNFERALTIYEAAYGDNHPNIAVLLNNLGDILQSLGDLDGAKAHYKRSLAIDEATYGPNHPKVAIRVNNLGSVLRALGDLSGAKSHYERALAIDEAAYGPNNPNVAMVVNNLGSVLQDLGDLPGAKAHYERAVKILLQFLGEDHPYTKGVRNNLASLRSLKSPGK